MNNISLKTSVNQFAQDTLSYYQQWLFDEPIFVSTAHTERLQNVQKIIFKLIKGFVEQYDNYSELMPLSAKAKQIIAIFSQKPYLPGTYRTDFVYDKNDQVKLIEITCRFALNGMFLPAVMHQHAQLFMNNTDSSQPVINPYEGIYAYLDKLRNGAERLVILKGADTRNESKIYEEIYQKIGVTVTQIQYSDLHDNLSLLDGAWIISELALEEIVSLDLCIIEHLAAQNIINDFRTVFLIHDKRFFSVLGNTSLQNAVLTVAEISLFKTFYINTYNADRHPEIVAQARADKNSWILKHRSLGKSQSIYAGIVTEEQAWLAVLETENLSDYVLQEWVPQRTHKASINSQPYSDYITGTLLFFDDNFFGFGDFRTSSFPVTNIVDHRKACSVILSEQDIKRINPHIAIIS